eukprot:CAMPEP_0174255660 /NCGR_PEP_ID=MMETSP0439-20130205/4980_1 /TAXON_ID=0 /ORGANISM="Stereomyxa ramosa, Strain Chinc5" /LENGTH=35 /DNA_ID= /DNA_START= /DNA_END= /DNA_ORIENTATION=
MADMTGKVQEDQSVTPNNSYILTGSQGQKGSLEES